MHDPIAIVGMSCRYGGASNLRAFWQLLSEGRCAMRPVPPDRYPIEHYYDPAPGTTGRIVSREGGFLDDLKGFDAGLFRLSPREVQVMDPQHRNLLEVA